MRLILPNPPTALRPERCRAVRIKIIIPGKMYIIPIAPVISFLPDVAKLNNSNGRVITLPPPIIKVKMYWLHETKKANKPPTNIPGRIEGRVI